MSSVTPEDPFWAAIDEDNEDFARTAAELNRRSAAAMGRSLSGTGLEPVETRIVPPTSGASVGRIRLHGRAVEGSLIPVRTAIKVLATFQELLASIAMATLGGSRSVRGRVPDAMRQLSDVLLSPQVSPGSAIFSVRAPAALTSDDQLVIASQSAIDGVARDLTTLLNHATVDDDQSLEDLERLGPRAARHVRALSSYAIDEGVYLDLAWTDAIGATYLGNLRAVEAVRLGLLIDAHRMYTERATIEGTLVTISSEQPLVLRTEGGERIRLEYPDAMSPEFRPFFNERVFVDVEIQVTEVPTTNVERTIYTLKALRLANEGQVVAESAEGSQGGSQSPPD